MKFFKELFFCVCVLRDRLQWTRSSSFTKFPDHTQRRTTVSRTPLDEWSTHRRNPYLTTHNTHNGQTSMPPVKFEPTISAGERQQTYALDRAATGTGKEIFRPSYFYFNLWVYVPVKLRPNSTSDHPLDDRRMNTEYRWNHDWQNRTEVHGEKLVQCHFVTINPT